MTKLKALTRKQLRAFIAILVAVCVVVPSVVLGLHVRAEQRLKAAAQVTAHKDNAYVETEKEVYDSYASVPGGPIDTYKIRLTTYTTAQSIVNTKTDTILLLERSDEMNDKMIYGRQKTNLYTYTEFGSKIFESHNDLYDQDNDYNDSGISILNNNNNNKYVIDPNNPHFYSYLCQTFTKESKNKVLFTVFGRDVTIPYTVNKYQYSLIDSNGNIYQSEIYEQNQSDTNTQVAIETITSWLPNNWKERLQDALADLFSDDGMFRSIDFEWKSNTIHPEATEASQVNARPTYTGVNRLYYRTGDFKDNATNETLWAEYNRSGSKPFWIKDNDNNWLKVTIEPGPTVTTPKGNEYVQYYVYRAFAKDETNTSNPDNALYTAVYGNPQYGTNQSVFQGFRVYDSTTSEIYWDNSLSHKALYSNRSTDVTKLDIEKEAVEDFLLNLYENSNKSELTADTQRVGIVAYANRSGSDSKLTKWVEHLTGVENEETVYRMIRNVYAIEANGRRRIDTGMEFAREEFENKSEGNNVNVIAFTVGNPSSSENNNNFEMKVADNALAEKQRIENGNYASKHFYTIGFYEGADSDELYGDSFRRLSHGSIPCDGSVGSYWGGTALAGWTNPDMSPADAAATNRFLNYLSSNYTPTSIDQKFSTRTFNPSLTDWTANLEYALGYKGHNTGIEGQKWIFPNIAQYGLSTGGNGYEILKETPAGAWNNNGFYQAATSVDDVVAAFDNIEAQLEMPLSKLDAGTTIRDYASEYFAIDPSKVTARVVNSDNSDNAALTELLKIEKDSSSVSVKGFDYSANYISATHPGAKVVIELEEKIVDGFLGGNNVPTNETVSAIYDSNNTLVENYNVPKEDITPKTALTVSNQSIYYSQEADLAELFTVPSTVDNGLNDFVDLTYYVIDPSIDNTEDEPNKNVVFTYTVRAGEKYDQGEFSNLAEEKLVQYPQLKENTTYQIKCVSSPIYEGTKSAENDVKNATVYVYKPIVTLKDTREKLSDTREGIDISKNKVSVEWSANAENAPLPEKSAPELEYTFYDKNNTPKTEITDADNHSFDRDNDFQVDVIIKGHTFPYETEVEHYVMKDGSSPVEVSKYTGSTDNLIPVTYIEVDEDGKETEKQLVIDGEPIYQTVMIKIPQTIERPDVIDSDEGQHFTTYINLGMNGEGPENTQKTNDRKEGNFTIYTGYEPFKVYLTKQFTGSYAVAEDVTFTIAPTTGATAENTVTKTIGVDEFNNLSAEVELGKLNYDTTYVLTEQHANDSKYNTSFGGVFRVSGKTDTSINDSDSADGERYSFSVPESIGDDNGKLYLTVTNAFDESQAPTVTGISEDKNSTNLVLIILAGMAVISGGAGAAYVYRKKDNFDETE